MTKEEIQIAQAAYCVGKMWDEYEGTEDFDRMVGKRVQHLIELVRNHLDREQPEVDLEKEIDAVWNPRFNLGWDEHSALSMNHAGFASIARHFWNKGYNARKEK